MNITKEENSVILKHPREEGEKEKTAVDIAKTVINYTPDKEEEKTGQSRLESAIASVGKWVSLVVIVRCPNLHRAHGEQLCAKVWVSGWAC